MKILSILKILAAMEALVFKEKLAALFNEVKSPLIAEGENDFAEQLDSCAIFLVLHLHQIIQHLLLNLWVIILKILKIPCLIF